MKKIFYIILLIVICSSSFALTSCTDESVEPSSLPASGGGASNDPFK